MTLVNCGMMALVNRWYFRLRLIFRIGLRQTTALHPEIKFFGQAIYGSTFFVHVPMHRHAFSLFPALNGGHVTIEVCRDFFHESRRSPGGVTDGAASWAGSSIAIS
jgi:hypothetical protein